MQLAGEGKLSLSDPVGKHAPPDLRSKGEPVAISHLLSHASGIPALGYAEALVDSMIGATERWIPVASYEDIFTFMSDAGEWGLARPGERWFYLNEGYVILGYIIGKVWGRCYEEYVRERILRPLGMSRSFFTREEVEADADVATPYIITDEGERKRSSYPYSPINSDGGLISNAHDLSKFVIMCLNRGRYEGMVLLSPELIEEIEKPRVSLPIQVYGGESYGYGFRIIPNFFGRKLVGHGGSVVVSTAYIGYVPEEGVGITILANGSGYLLSHIGHYGLALALGEDPEELPFVKLERALELLAGAYETYKGTMRAHVRVAGGILQLEIKDRYRTTVVPLVPENLEGDVKTFFAFRAGGRLPVEFVVRGRDVDLIYERYRLKKIGGV